MESILCWPITLCLKYFWGCDGYTKWQNYFSYTSRCQWQIAFGSGVVISVQCLFFVLCYCLVWTCKDIWHPLTASVKFICVPALLCMDDIVSLHIWETRTFKKLEVVFDFMNFLFTGGRKTTSKLPFLFPPQYYRRKGSNILKVTSFQSAT